MITERRNRAGDSGWRMRALRLFFLLLGLVVIGRMFMLQILSASFYNALAEGQYSLYEELVPERGDILVRDHNDRDEYPIATNAPRAFVYADPRKVANPVQLGKDIAHILQLEGYEEYERFEVLEKLRAAQKWGEVAELEAMLWQARRDRELAAAAEETAKNLSLEVQSPAPEVAGVAIEDPATPLPPFTLDETNQVATLIARLSKSDDPYEPVARNVTDEQLKLIEALDAEGLAWLIEDARSYPETGFGGHVLGFVGRDNEGQPIGRYGLEGYFEDFLSGSAGNLYSQTDASGRWIGVGERHFRPAIDGGDLLLTIDRTLQAEVCELLKAGVEQFDADSGTAIVMDPATGRILAMCGAPDFYPLDYHEVDSIAAYNNPAIFTAYEPGSIFKPITMAAALDVGAVTPESRFVDPGFVEIDQFTIRNAADGVFGNVSMIEVLEESINTGMVWTMRQMGRDTLQEYIHRFGFGELTGIELKTEVEGNVSSLEKDAEVYAATASFGQGITTTPMQMVSAYAAMANGGMLMRPYLVEEMRYPDGTVEKMYPQPLGQVIQPKTATTIGAMLVSVVEYGHGKKAGVPGYYIAGKTGTAQIARNGVYSATEFNGSFAGFGPVNNPKFAMIVKIENPKKGVIYAESTAAPVFGQIAAFLLEYYGVAPERPLE